MTGVRPRVTRRGSQLDWVKFDFLVARDGTIDPTDKALYAAIASFVDADTRESPETQDLDLNGIPLDVPTRPRLAACIGRSVDTVDRSTKRLETRGLLRVHRQADPDNPRLMLPSEYELLDHELWDQRAAERAARRAARAAAQGSSSSEGGRMSAATPGRMGAAGGSRMGAAVKEEREVEEENVGEMAPSARSAHGRRQASTGSRGLGEGGSAAPATSKPRLSKQQRDQVKAVRALLPRELDTALGDRLPANVSAAIVEALAAGQPRERTAEQLVTYRVEKRWNGYWAAQLLPVWKAEQDAGRTPRPPYGAMVSMLKDTAECGNLACDDRTDIHTGGPCAACATRAQDRRAGRAIPDVAPQDVPAVPGQRAPEPAAKVALVDCGNPHCPRSIPVAAGPLCGDCREQQEAGAAGAALAAQWAAEQAEEAAKAAAGVQLVAELEQEDAERAARERAEAAARAAAEEERRRVAAEEDARLRAEFARQHPELAAFNQQGPPPF